MRILVIVLFIFCILIFSCTKTKSEEESRLTLPAIVNGTLESINFQNINYSQHRGLGFFTIKTSEGKRISFQFNHAQNITLYNDNSTITFDSASILLTTSLIEPDEVPDNTIYKNLKLPNAIHVKFNSRATVEETYNAKEINASFTSATKLYTNFFQTYGDIVADKYEKERELAISDLNQIIANFNDYKNEPWLQPALTYVRVNQVIE
jgi:hypothetical protein